MCLCSAAENLFEFHFLELVGLSGLATNLETSRKDGKETDSPQGRVMTFYCWKCGFYLRGIECMLPGILLFYRFKTNRISLW